jgi:hypothetical protein
MDSDRGSRGQKGLTNEERTYYSLGSFGFLEDCLKKEHHEERLRKIVVLRELVRILLNDSEGCILKEILTGY